jgi:NTE family protein
MAWDPAVTRERFGLKLSPEQLATVAQNFLPLTPDQFMADMVFEGGGVLGVAFLGSMRCCDDAGVRCADAAGTSAGAITAALVASGYSIDELEAIFGPLDYTSFLTKKTSWLLLGGDPSNDMGDGIFLMLGALVMTREEGKYSTDPFHDWMVQRMSARNVRSFADLPKIQRVGEGAPSRRDLRVVAADISRGTMVVLPDSLSFAPYKESGPDPLAFEVAEAVRLSMSIPLFFAPGKLTGSSIVDGAVASNFPLWLFDAPPGTKPPYPTFGFRLMDRQPDPQISSAVGVLKSLLTTMRTAHDRYYLQEKDLGRVINIDVTKTPTFQVTATKFNLSDDDKAELYRRGYVATREFLLDKDGKGWNWKRHLIARGVPEGSI